MWNAPQKIFSTAPGRKTSLVARGLALAIMFISIGAKAHISPSLKTNNRYVSVSVTNSGIRLGYTIFFGKIPGHTARLKMDTDGNGTLSQTETDQFAAEIAQVVSKHLEIRSGESRYDLAWSDVSVGLGEVQGVEGDSFRLDLGAWLCLPGSRNSTFSVFDKSPLLPLGEGEIKIQGGPGVQLDLPAETAPQFAVVGAWTQPSTFTASRTGERKRSPDKCVALLKHTNSSMYRYLLLGLLFLFGVAIVIAARRSQRETE